MLEKAFSSLKEAENLADTLSKIELRIQSSSGRLFKDVDDMRDSFISFSSRMSSSNSLFAEKSQGGWDIANPQIRRILADIALEVCSVFNIRMHLSNMHFLQILTCRSLKASIKNIYPLLIALK